MNNKILNGNGECLYNVKFVIGEHDVKIENYDDTIKKYIKIFTVDRFTNFYSNTIAFIPLATINKGYGNSIFDVSIDNNWVTLSADHQMDAVVKVLMIQYDV